MFVTFSCLVALAFGAPNPSRLNLSWNTFTPFDGKNYADAMPLGNGRVVALAWGNGTSGGVHFFVRSPQALHSDSQVFTIARVDVAVAPNLCATGPFWNQTLHLEDGSVTLLCGGASLADHALAMTVFVDASSDAVIVTAASRDGVTPFSLTATLNSVRPSARFSYALDFQCDRSSSGPDVYLALPAPAPPNHVALYHANDVAGGDTSLFNSTMHQQQLAPLLPLFTDPLDGRIFGAAMSGGAGADGSGAALNRVSATALASAAPAPAFALQVAVRVDPRAGGDAAGWATALAAALAAPVAPAARAAGNAAFWGAFWARSYVSVNSPDPAPPPPSPPPAVGALGHFPCGGDLRARQTVGYDPATGEVSLPLGLCVSMNSVQGSAVTAAPCGANTSAPWRLLPCAAKGCDPATEFLWEDPRAHPARWVAGFSGADCPWLISWTIDDPTGVEKNELFYFNSTDATLRTRCANCPGTCLTVNHTSPSPPAPPEESVLNTQYAYTRFINAVQGGGGVDAPIPFNGMLMMNQVGANGPSDVDYRQWGPNHWFQNTRFPYQTMLPAGDVEGMRVVLDWVSGFIPLASARTNLLLPGEAGIFFTETVTSFGLYQGGEYGCDAAKNRPAAYPEWLEGPGGEGGWVRYDFGGNGLAEAGLMAIDYFWHTLDLENSARYIPFATAYADFYGSHYPNRTADGKLMIWPSQVLESWWCEWPGSPGVNWDPTKCSQNDLPNVAALRSLVLRLLQLPGALLTPAQRTRYQALAAILPDLPLDADGTYGVAMRVSEDAGHNSEGPWLYATHPFRLNTVGAAVASTAVDLSASRATYRKQGWFQSNQGWSYGTINTALLGYSAQAYAMVLDRARQAPPGGYRCMCKRIKNHATKKTNPTPADTLHPPNPLCSSRLRAALPGLRALRGPL